MSRHRPELLVCLLLIVITLAAYWQIQYYPFINLDDTLYITQNRWVQGGLTKAGLRWAFTFNGISYWHPLTWLSHMVDCQLYGLNPRGHHFNNLLLHTANTVLLFLALKVMTGALWRSAAVAALFALHPMNVESVAWVASRKSLLSAFLGMLALLAYSRYARRPAFLTYVPVLLLFGLALAAKPVIVTLPFLFLLLDYWPLNRFLFKQDGAVTVVPGANPKFQKAPVLHLVLEKLPFLMLSLSAIGTCFLSSRSLGIVISAETLPIWLRIKNALVSYVTYILKMVWPLNLTVFYPYPETVPIWQYAGAALFLLGVSCLLFHVRRRAPFLLVGWLWYLGMLFPVIGLMQQGLWPAFADRFVYLPFIGLFMALVWISASLLSQSRYAGRGAFIPVAVVLLLLGITTWAQARYWRDSISLFEHALDVTSKNHLAHYNLGAALYKAGERDKALFHLTRALKIMPNNAQFHNALGAALLGEDRMEEAVFHLSKALKMVPNYADAHLNMGKAYWKKGLTAEAQVHYRESIRIKPLAEAHHGLGLTLAGQDKLQEAAYHYKQALRLKPDYAEVHNDLGVVLVYQGQIKEAVSHFKEAMRINPDYENPKRNLDLILRKTP